MSDDPQLLKKVKAWRAAGATDEELDDLIAEYDHQHRFRDPNQPAAVQGSRERIVAGEAPREETGGEALLGGLGAAAHGATLGFSDEAGGGLAAIGALLPGGESPGQAYRRVRDINRNTQKAFGAEHPAANVALNVAGGVLNPVGRIKGPVTAGKVAGTGALVGGLAGLGTGEGDLASQLKSTAIGATAGAVIPTAAYGVGKGAAWVAPRLARLFGYVTEGQRNKAAEEAILTAIQRSGQKVEDVLARAEEIAQGGGTPSLAEAMGPAGPMALDRLAPVGNEIAGQASRAAASAEPELASALNQVAIRHPASINLPSPIGMKTQIARNVFTRGLRKAGSKESETALAKLLAGADEFLGPMPAGRVVGNIAPTGGEELATMLAQRAVAPAAESPSLPVELQRAYKALVKANVAEERIPEALGKMRFADPEAQRLARQLAAEAAGGAPSSTSLPRSMTPADVAKEVRAAKVRGARGVGGGGTYSGLGYAASDVPAPPPTADEDLATMLARTLEEMKRKGSSGSLRKP